jgi:hypothetical protein
MESESVVTEQESQPTDKGPVFYNPKVLTLMSSLASVFSWVVLVAFIADVVVQFLNVNSTLTQQGMAFGDLFKQMSALSFLVSNLSTPLFTGIALFFVLQGVSIGLNVLFEIDMKSEDEE